MVFLPPTSVHVGLQVSYYLRAVTISRSNLQSPSQSPDLPVFIPSLLQYCVARTMYFTFVSPIASIHRTNTTESNKCVLAYGIAATAAAAALLTTSPHVLAISGGGLDYAGGKFEGATFDGGSYEDKDFSGGSFRGATFKKAVLRNARFFNADLRDADLSLADLSGSTVERAVLKDAVLRDAIFNGAYLSESVLEAKDIHGADFTDALIAPVTAAKALCERDDATGTNAITGVDTRERYVG